MVFILVISQAIPRYTLCTSLGQLVNERELQETLAAFYLEEAKLKEMEEQEDEDWEEMHAVAERQTACDGSVQAVGARRNAKKFSMAVWLSSSDSSSSSVVTTCMTRWAPKPHCSMNSTK